MATEPGQAPVVPPEGVSPAAEPPTAPTAPSAWKAPEDELVTLPSGNVARLRRPSILQMIRGGEIPNPLLGAAINAMTGEQPATTEEIKQRADFMAYLVAEAFVEPPVAREEPVPEGALSLSAISDADHMFVTAWIGRQARELTTFRDDGASEGARDDEPDVRDQAE